MAGDILARIVAHKRDEIDAAKARVPSHELQAMLSDAPPVRDFLGSLRASPGIAAIAEVKKASPSAGLIRPDFDAVALARLYANHGAACISVLTDERYFQGSLDHLRAVRQHVDRPVLRKDFLLDTYQVLEARVAGADCVLLIAECLDECRLRELYFYAAELGLATLIELYDPVHLERVLALEPELVGVNNRDLKTMTIDLAHSIRLRERVPESVTFVSESGIKTRDDVQRLETARVNAILVGETLMRAPHPGEKLRELLGR